MCKTNGLDNALADADAAEGRYAKRTKGEVPPLVQGDIFTSMFEGATDFALGPCEIKGDAALCSVNLAYGRQRMESESKWTDQVYLVRENGAWRVDDVGYGGKWDFARRGRLRESLKAVVAEADKAK